MYCADAIQPQYDSKEMLIAIVTTQQAPCALAVHRLSKLSILEISSISELKISLDLNPLRS